MRALLPPSKPASGSRSPHGNTGNTLSLLTCALLATFVLGLGVQTAQAEEEESPAGQVVVGAAGEVSVATPVQAAATAVINFDALAREEALLSHEGPIRTWMPPEYEEPAEPFFPAAPDSPVPQGPGKTMVPSPSPSSSFMGLNDIPMADSLYIVIPPDVGGAVGPNRVMCSFNNNYRIQDKVTGATISTLGTATFWAPVVAAGERLSLTDPRTLYDPYNNRWISVMQTYTTGAGKILVGVSQTTDPAGVWNLYSFNSAVSLDFPTVGFNKNWISVAINRYSNAGVFQEGINLVVNYPSARVGVGTGTIFTHAAGTHFCSAPCVTYSSTEDTLFVVTHLSSAGATYQLDIVTGTSAAPVYTSGGSQTRTGGGWVQPSGNLLPQSAPNAGASACGATPCKIETQDSQVRSAPAYRGGFIYYTQTVGLPSGVLTHTGVQWTRLTASTGVFSQGGRIEDPTATATNGGKWYAYPHIAVNSAGDFIVGYTQFSSTQHPATGYSIHLAADGAGVLRDPLIYHAGEDYYHKTFSTATGRNRWGDFSTAQVDPSDDQTLWTLQEYAKTRTGTDDGNTGSNSSKWSSWWAGVSTIITYTITASAGPGGTIAPSGSVLVPSGNNQAFTITPSACYHIVDVLVDGGSVGPVPSYTFTNVLANHTISASFAINTYTITATAGTGGSIAPSGAVGVNCGNNQPFTITANAGYTISDVLVDAVSVGAVPAYTFLNVQANHTIDAQFTADQYTLTTAVVGSGSLLVVPLQAFYAYGDTVHITATADPGWAFDHWTGDASGNANPLEVIMNASKSITSLFIDIAAPTGVAVVSANGGEVWNVGSVQNVTWTATDNVGVTSVDLEYSIDGGATFPDTIATGITNSGSYAWTVPNAPTLTARIRVTARDAAANSAADASDADFEIHDDLTGVSLAMLGGRDGIGVYPNPASPGTMHVLYAVKNPAVIELSVYDVSGRLVRRLASGTFSGARNLLWDGRDERGKTVPVGIYFVRFKTSGGLHVNKQVTLLR